MDRAAAPPPLPPRAAAPRGPLRVLLVDDHAVVREGYRRLLESEGDIAVVGECADAAAAQARLQSLADAADAAGGGAPALDALVLDLSMPGRGGLDALRHFVARWPTLRVLVFTMHEHPAVVAQALAAGAAGYVTKTAEPARLVDALRRVAAGERDVLCDDAAAARGAAAAQAPHERLSAREFDVYRLLAEGCTLDDIAARLCVSAKTVANVQTQVRAKLGLANAVELLRHAQRHGLDATWAPRSEPPPA